MSASKLLQGSLIGLGLVSLTLNASAQTQNSITDIKLLQKMKIEGGGSTGGGDAVLCKDGRSVLGDIAGDLKESSKSYYNNVISYYFDSFVRDGKISEKNIEAGVLRYLDKYRPKDAPIIRKNIKTLNFSYSNDELPTLNTGIKVGFWSAVVDKCKKQQLAVQYFQNYKDFKNFRVLVYSPIYDQFSALEKVLLKIHEAYVRLAFDRGDDLKSMETYARERVGSIFSDFKNLRKSITPNIHYLGHDSSVRLVLQCGPDLGYNHGYYSDYNKDISAYLFKLVLQPDNVAECVYRGASLAGFKTCPKPTQGVSSSEKFYETAGDLAFIDIVTAFQNCDDLN